MKKEYKSPLGKFIITARGGCVTEIKYADFQGATSEGECEKTAENAAVLELCTKELDAYFAGELREFSVEISADGTEFRRRVWAELLKIPYGETISYAELARRVGNPKASRAVGGANHHNPINIIVPCHRVIGADGALTGYGGGLENKRILLEHEGAFTA